ncbi:MAG: hypothetical protein JKY60_18500 [Kordiimonadaceae bacterium]|nr:hypothetical protein [Kordiimonadaceae bacterium]
MNRRSISPTKAHADAFNHYVKLEVGVNIQAWLAWLKKAFGDANPNPDTLQKQRWGMIGGRVGFMKSDDAATFIAAAKPDLAQALKKVIDHKYRRD